MKKNCLIVIIVIAALILFGVIFKFFLQEQEILPPLEIVLPEERFRSYLELPSHSGKFLEFDEAKSEISILCLNTETMRVATESFKIDEDTIFSKMNFESSQPDFFPEEDFKEVKQEAQTEVFYLAAEKENEIPLARLIQIEASF